MEEAVRKKRGVVWVEVADRPANTAVPSGEKVAFLRLVKSIRSNSAGLLVRDAATGQVGAPKNVVALASSLLQIEQCELPVWSLDFLPQQVAGKGARSRLPFFILRSNIHPVLQREIGACLRKSVSWQKIVLCVRQCYIPRRRVIQGGRRCCFP